MTSIWLTATRVAACSIPLLLTACAVTQPPVPAGPPRFQLLTAEQMTPAQRELANNIRSGPRAAVPGSAANNAALGSPFNVFLRSPELGDHLQKVGSYIRFKSTMGQRLNEFAILITARQWNAQYEWHAHHRLALQAGLSPEVAAAVAAGGRLVSDAFASSWWILADADGNEACVCTWQDRT